MTKAITQTYNIISDYRRHISTIILATCLVFVLIYAFNIYTLINQTVSLQKIESQIATIDKSVHKIDSQYIELSSALTPDVLAKYGMNEGQASKYIYRTVSLGQALASGHEL